MPYTGMMDFENECHYYFSLYTARKIVLFFLILFLDKTVTIDENI